MAGTCLSRPAYLPTCQSLKSLPEDAHFKLTCLSMSWPPQSEQVRGLQLQRRTSSQEGRFAA